MVSLSSFLPQELFDEIANYVPQASRLKYIEAKKRERVSPLGNWIWHLFFKPIQEVDKHWFLTVKQLNEKNKDVDYYHGALLTLLGSDLRKVNSGQDK